MNAGDLAAALLQPPGSPIRRSAIEEIERQIWRACWRAERRGRRLPFNVRQSSTWVNAQRRVIAKEITQALRSLGAGAELTRAVCTQACERFPRDGVVIPNGETRRPRELGDSPRQRGKNPRARGESPRQRGTSPRQKRAAADLSTVDEISPATSSADAEQIPTLTAANVPPEFLELKAQIFASLEPHERMSALRRAREDRERLQRSQNAHPSPPAPRS